MHKNLQFDIKQDIHMSSKNYEEISYSLDLDLLTLSYKSCVSYPTRRGLVRKSNNLRPIYLSSLFFKHQTASDHPNKPNLWAPVEIQQQTTWAQIESLKESTTIPGAN